MIFSYIYINQTDPDETLSWLVSELLQSEAKGEKVARIYCCSKYHINI